MPAGRLVARPTRRARLGRPLERVPEPAQPAQHGAAQKHRHPRAQHKGTHRAPDRCPTAAAPFPRGRHVESDERYRRAREHGQIEPPEPVHAQLPPRHRRRHDEEREGEGERVREVTAQVHHGLQLDGGAEASPQQSREHLSRRLDPALGPSPLLHQQGGRGARQLGGNAHVIAEDEPPSRHLRPVADVQVLGQGIVLPAARIVQSLPAPQPRRPVEVEEPARPVAPLLFDEEVPVKEESLGAGQP